MKKMLFVMFSLALVLTFTAASKPPKSHALQASPPKNCPDPPCPFKPPFPGR